MEGRRGGGVKPWATILEPGGNRWWEIGDVVGGTEGDSTEGVKSGRTVSWLSSQERHLNPSLQLYSSFGWRFLICHADFLTFNFHAHISLGKDYEVFNLTIINVAIPICVSLSESTTTLPGCKPSSSAADGLPKLSFADASILVGVETLQPSFEVLHGHFLFHWRRRGCKAILGDENKS
ncbi:hypothetical protein MUK42_28634 [Musa troglodytarum]|uniref:Uncharacterized protein n=1 Tax=Musa troglodytarum TaxID=320322 RepID=A0A9E7JNA5_9LILI|nr:hypothetical protein MUK42_28634 [Musa troglodytarum]